MKKSSIFSKAACACLSALLLCGAVASPDLFGISAAVDISDCDVNRDGIVNGKDAVRIMKYIRRPDLYADTEKADVNGDGYVTRADIVAIQSNYGETCEIPSDTPADLPGYDELVAQILDEAGKVVKFADDNNFVYDDAYINPAYNWLDLNMATAINSTERESACDRLVSWVFHRVGYTDQRYFHGGFRDSDYQRYKFQTITNVNDVKAGDIVLVNGGGHQFICAGPNLRYDHGSVERIQRTGGYAYRNGTTLPFQESISNFHIAYRPNPEGLTPASAREIYNTVIVSEAYPAAGATTVYTAANGTGERSFNYSYNPYSSQYELNLTLSSNLSSSDSSVWNSSYVGVRLPSSTHNPTLAGGIWLAFRAENRAYLYTGIGCNEAQNGTLWNEPLISLPLPESFSTAHRITVVDSGDVIKYFMYTSSGAEYLICSIRVNVERGQIAIRNNSGKLVYCGLTALTQTGYFKVWSHLANTVTSNISIERS